MSLAPVNIPNLLSAGRLLLAPVLLFMADQQRQDLFLSLLALSLCTDAFDGYLARKLNQTSALGARLDGWADYFTYGAMVIGLIWLWPEVFDEQIWFLYTGLICYLVPTITGLLKFRQLPSYHTWSAKLAAVLMAPAYFIMVLFDQALLFRVVVIFHIWVACEELIITMILSSNRTNVPSMFHAREMMRRQRLKIRARRDQLRRRISGQSNDKCPIE
ncbi:MAG TPA: CDP-alcohol phosphatidyltransferase family protein [Porticoccaceae bacterium]|nr:CDP-alcohol phosphatidyltransferase family protein [Porticoccaceae bacterium]